MAEQTAIASKNRKQTIWGIILLAGPTALFIITFLLFAINNYMFSAYALQSSGEFANVGIVQTTINILAFLFGVVAFITWLPGVIIGIILLATRTKSA